MRITIVMGFFLPVPALAGGATEKIWTRLSRDLSDAGHDVTIISRRWPGLPDHEQQGRLTSIRIAGRDHTRWLARNLWRDFRWGLRVLKAIPSGDVVVCNTVALPVFLKRFRPDAGLVSVLLGRMPKGQIRAYGSVDLVLATSQAVANKARQENPRLASRIMPFAQPIDWTLHRNASRQQKSDTPLTIGYVGRIHPEKGLETLLAAAIELLGAGTRVPDWTLLLVGPTEVPQGGGGPAYLRSLLNTYGRALGDRLRIEPPCFDTGRLAEIYGSIHIFCYPSRAARGEGLSFAPLEAMAAGAVPVLSQLDCYRDILEPGINGFQFAHTQPDAHRVLATMLQTLLEDRELRIRIATAAQSSVRRFDYASTVTDLLAQFARLTTSQPQP